MRKLTCYVLTAMLVVSFLAIIAPAKQLSAQETNQLWSGQLTFEDLGAVDENVVATDPNCEQAPISKKVIVAPANYTGDLEELISLWTSRQSLDACVYSNSQGAFTTSGRYGEKLYSPSDSLNEFIRLESAMISPAPAGKHVLLQDWQYSFSTSYYLSYTDTFRASTKFTRSGLNGVYHHNGVQTVLKLKSGSRYSAKLHAFSPNGRYVAVHSGNWIHKIDLETLRLTPVQYVGSGKIESLSIDRTGQHIAKLTSNALTVIHASRCQASYGFGAWEMHAIVNSSEAPGCLGSGNLLASAHNASVIDIYSGNANRQYRRAHFDQVGDTILFAFGEKRSGESTYSWREIAIAAEDYISTARGYLAMGDSFVSGEGDLQGKEWYEPGTDEQGDKSTFAGRNLCHLSRRSYPYLMAVDLGYLSSPTTPPADGLFHSVACSGAKIHNIVRGSRYGVIDLEADEITYANADNQYRPNRDLLLNLWQPGALSQVGIKNINNLEPETITLSIGGNDIDFGGFLAACTLPGTCNIAKSGSYESNIQGKLIAEQKLRLEKAFNKVKASAPEARIYVHGYPEIVNPEIDELQTLWTGNGFSERSTCGANVHLDLEERRAVVEGTRYLNEVIKAAAAQAGVFYVDISKALDGGRLCDKPSEKVGDNLLVNGVTQGNDISMPLICNSCLGNESYHPTPGAHKKYSEAIISQTNNLTVSMPTAVNTPIPMPTDFFGSEVNDFVMTKNSLLVSDSIHIAEQAKFIQYSDQADSLQINQGGMMPGSTFKVVVRSEPITIGEYVIDSIGMIKQPIRLPASLQPGAHTLYVEGLDRFGEKVTLFERFIVGSSITDFDGDGIENEMDSCPAQVNSGIDDDGDGTDDVCDAALQIPDPPVEPPQPPEPPAPKHRVCSVIITLNNRLPHFSEFTAKLLFNRFNCS